MNNKLFSCFECGFPVAMLALDGRTIEYHPGYEVPIPVDFEMPTCTNCRKPYIDEELAKRLDPVLKKAFLRQQAAHFCKLVEWLKQKHNVTQIDIVRACGITPSHLSHILAGKRRASLTLSRLLEAFVKDEREFRRHVDGLPWRDILVFPPRHGKSALVSWSTGKPKLEQKWDQEQSDHTSLNINTSQDVA